MNEVRTISRDDFTIEHLTVGRKSRGDAHPVVKLTPRQFKNRLTILVHPRGKAVLDGGSGGPNELARALSRSARPFVAFDPLFVGESLDPRSPSPHRPTTAHFETYNPVPAADQMQDLEPSSPAKAGPTSTWSISSSRTMPATRPWSPARCSKVFPALSSSYRACPYQESPMNGQQRSICPAWSNSPA